MERNSTRGHPSTGRRRISVSLSATALLVVALPLTALSLSFRGGPESGDRTSAAPGTSGAMPPEITVAQERELERAEAVLTRRCLERHGFPVPPLAGESGAEPVPGDRDFPYVVDDPGWARRHGYGSDIAMLRSRASRSGADQEYFRSLTPSGQAALTAALNGNGPTDPGPTVRLPGGATVGHSNRGCTAAAQRQLYGDFDTWFRARAVVNSLDAVRRGRVLGDSRFGAAVERWARCMRREGHRYASPGAARAAFLDAPAPRPRRLEIRTATAEASCARRTGLAEVARDLDGRYDTAVRDQYRQAVMTQRRLAHAALRTARAVQEPT